MNSGITVILCATVSSYVHHYYDYVDKCSYNPPTIYLYLVHLNLFLILTSKADATRMALVLLKRCIDIIILSEVSYIGQHRRTSGYANTNRKHILSTIRTHDLAERVSMSGFFTGL